MSDYNAQIMARLKAYDEKARLEAAVVTAALAERRAGRALTRGHLWEPPPGAERAWLDALGAYEQAADALLAFDGEEAGDE